MPFTPSTTLPSDAIAGAGNPPVDFNGLKGAVSEIRTAGLALTSDAVSDAVFTVAASNTPAAQKASADYVCDGTDDHVELQAAIDAAASNSPGGGDVVLLPGTYDVAATVSVGHPSDGTGTYRVHLRFERGARIRWSGLAVQMQAILKIESSDVLVSNPWVEGSGSKGNGVGISFGGDVATFGGRYTKTVYRSCVRNPYVVSCYAGICFAVNHGGSNSSGDNSVFGGYVSNCVEGIRSEGFTNRVYGFTAATCDYNIHGTADRNSHMIEVFGATLNQWAQAAVWLEKDKGSTFVNLWAEHTAAQSATPTQAILLGGSGTTAHNTRFLGSTSLTLFDETYAVRHQDSNGCQVENLIMSTNGSTPGAAIVRVDSTMDGVDRYGRVVWMTGSVPAGYDWAMLRSTASTTGRAIIEAVPSKAGSPSNSTDGGGTPVPSVATHQVDVSGPPDAATYWAKDRTGDVVAWAADDSAGTVALDVVLNAILADGVHISFGPGRFHFLSAPLGTESWANTNGLNLTRVKGVTLSGAGKRATVLSLRSNTVTASPDLGVFLFTNCEDVTLRDMQIEFCGAYMSTMEAVNCNQGNGFQVERVRFLRSKSTTLTMDGGDVGKTAKRDIIRDCEFQGRPPTPMVDLATTGGSLANGTSYTYVVAWRDADLAYLTGVSATASAGTATLTTAAAHGFAVGETITVLGLSGYNGRYTVASVPTSTTLTYNLGSTPANASGGTVVGPGTTKPSDPSRAVTTANGTSKATVYLPIGPYTTTARVVYRYDGATWQQVAQVNDNTTTTWVDTGVAGSAATFGAASTIPHSGVQLLAAKGVLVTGNIVDGCGDPSIPGSAAQGIRVAQKQSASSDHNIIAHNTVRQSGSHGIFLVGADSNVVQGNMISNPGTVATKAQAIRCDASSGVNATNNLVTGNRCYDDQTASSWSGGASTSPSITVRPGSDNNLIQTNHLTGSVTTGVSDSGTGNVVANNFGG